MSSGISIVVNEYLSRNWTDNVLGPFRIESRVQTYVVLNDRQNIALDPTAWELQSNTFGIVLVEGQTVNVDWSSLDNPRYVDTGVVVGFVAGAKIAESSRRKILNVFRN